MCRPISVIYFVLQFMACVYSGTPLMSSDVLAFSLPLPHTKVRINTKAFQCKRVTDTINFDKQYNKINHLIVITLTNGAIC